MDAMQKPTHYLYEEGGRWEQWPYGYLNTNDLETCIKDLVNMAIFPILAVKFEDGSVFNMPIEKTLPDYDKIIRGEIPLHDSIISYPLKDNAQTFEKPSIKLGDSLNEAHSIINGDRQDSYGNPEDSFKTIAKYWRAYLETSKYKISGRLEALDVAHMMMLFKLARCSGQHSKRDNYIDIQGYAAIAADRLVKE